MENNKNAAMLKGLDLTALLDAPLRNKSGISYYSSNEEMVAYRKKFYARTRHKECDCIECQRFIKKSLPRTSGGRNADYLDARFGDSPSQTIPKSFTSERGFTRLMIGG